MNQILFLKNYDSNFIPLNGSILLLIINFIINNFDQRKENRIM